MSSLPLSAAFDASHAEVYDRQVEPLTSVKDALHLVLASALRELPDGAVLLLVGAGTGAEARFLARVNPTWRFVLVDPSEPMLAVARRHAAAEGFADRCVFHAGFVSSLPDQPLDAATSVLASHFVNDDAGRRAYYADIARRLRPGAVLFEATLCADRTAPAFETLMELWLGVLGRTAPMTGEKGSTYRAAFGRDFAVHGPDVVEAMIAGAGFSPPVPCVQLALVRAWWARRR